MNTLSELKDKLHMEYYTDVQEEYRDFADVLKLLSDYIDNKYSDRLARIDNSRIREFMLDEWYISERNKLCYMNVHQKMSMVYVDDNLIQIINASSEIFRIALSKCSGCITPEQQLRAKKLLDDMQSVMPLVATFNCNTAKMELSEAVVDTNYILGLSKNYSMRMHDPLRYGGTQ